LGTETNNNTEQNTTEKSRKSTITQYKYEKYIKQSAAEATILQNKIQRNRVAAPKISKTNNQIFQEEEGIISYNHSKEISHDIYYTSLLNNSILLNKMTR